SNDDASLELLHRIDGLHDSVVRSYVLDLEFKRNRQRIILQAWRSLKFNSPQISPPAYLRGSDAARVAKNKINESRDRVETLRGRVIKAVEDPAQHDPVYKCVQRLHRSKSDINLK